ncbi:HNH endonuclease [Deferrisoma palaeochoriense]
MKRSDVSGALATYADRLRRLRTDRSRVHYPASARHRAPHKPLLLLCVLDLVAGGAVTENFFEPGPDLVELFGLYWSRVMPPERRGSMALPFFHLRSDGFWHLVPAAGKEAQLQAARRVDTLPRLRSLVLGATLDEPLFGLLRNPTARETLRGVLLETYFEPGARDALREQAAVNQGAYRYSELLLHAGSDPSAVRGAAADVEPRARDQGFRRAVTRAYEHRCGFCGVRVITAEGHTAVEAAHIVPRRVSGDDRVVNGLGLCRLCHWSFDEGLLGLDPDYRIRTSPQLSRNSNLPAHLGALGGRTLLGPADEAFWPAPEAVAWHRREVFRRR